MAEPDLFTIKSHVLERYQGSGGEVVVPEGVCAIGREAFYDCATLTRIILPGSLRRIGKLAFAGCSGLTSVELPEGLERIDGSAFVFCTALTNVALPGSLWRMEGNVFRGCAALEAVEVSPQNRYYYSVDGVLFDGNNALICFPPAKGPAFSIPPGITEIGPYGDCVFIGRKGDIPVLRRGDGDHGKPLPRVGDEADRRFLTADLDDHCHS